MLATLLIVFREVLEAGLIVGIVLAATKGVPGGEPLGCLSACVAGLAGACIVAAFAGEIGALFAGSGQELFNACILILAVGMLTWHNVWMASHGREIAQEMKEVGAAVASGEKASLWRLPLFAAWPSCARAPRSSSSSTESSPPAERRARHDPRRHPRGSRRRRRFRR